MLTNKQNRRVVGENIVFYKRKKTHNSVLSFKKKPLTFSIYEKKATQRLTVQKNI